MEAARIIIVGGGFAGATLAEHLNRRVARDVEVVVISSDNHMVFTPMLAEVAGRSLSGFDVVMPGRQMAPPGHLVNGHGNQRRSKDERGRVHPPGWEEVDALLCSPGSRMWLRRKPRCCSRHGSSCLHAQDSGRRHGLGQRSHRTF